MNFNVLLYFILFLGLLLTGCKTPMTVEQAGEPLPYSYEWDSDSSNIADINWKEYFADDNLMRLIDEGLSNNLDALIALQRIEQSKASVLYYKGALLPAVGAGGSAALNRYGLYTMDGSGNITTEILPGEIMPFNLPDYYVGLQASWEADITGRLRNRKRAAAARYLATVEGRKWLVTNLIAEVVSAYYNLLALDQELAITRSTILLQENALSIVTIQKQVGRANELAVKQFQAQLQNTRSLEAEIQQQIVEGETRMALLLGKFPQQIERDSASFHRQIPALLQTGVPSDLLRNRPDIKESELEIIAARADLKAARAAFYPSLSINGDLGFQAFKTSLLFNNPESFVFGLFGGLSAPLLNRNAIKAEFNAANAYQVESLYHYQRSILNAYAEVYTAVKNFNNLVKIAEHKSNEVSVLAEAMEVSAELYRTGRANYLEVLFTQQNALSAKFELVNVRKRQLDATVTLYRSLGGGWK
jgi:NodT family efflux transporter outer membrane factor (OMF) lipoprotein